MKEDGKAVKMIKLGEKQKLTIIKKVEFGVYLAPSKAETEEKADLTLRTHEASRLLFGPLGPMATAEIPKEKAAFAAANFPLYLYTPPFDKV